MLTQTKAEKVVTLLSTNLTHGDIQNFFGVAIWEQRGLMAALTQKGHARSSLWKAGTERPLSDIFLMTLPNDNDALLMELPGEDKCEDLLRDLVDEQCDYLVVDCAADIMNPISDVALVRSDIIFCLHTPGSASFQWYRAMRSFIAQLDLDLKMKHLIYAPDKSTNASQYINETGISIAAELPFVRQAKQYENRGVPICSEISFNTRGYSNAMRRLCSLI
jgi:hypothetical protein